MGAFLVMCDQGENLTILQFAGQKFLYLSVLFACAWAADKLDSRHADK